jgi:hypothetical protein
MLMPQVKNSKCRTDRRMAPATIQSEPALRCALRRGHQIGQARDWVAIG